jgi:hypothetical protein
MDEYWDSQDQWVDESRCIVCKGSSAELVCSATCSDVLALGVSNASV